MFVNAFNFAYPGNTNFTNIEIFSTIIQQTVVYLSSLLLILFFVTLLFVKLNVSTIKYSSIYGLIKNTNVLLSILIFILTLVKFLIYL